MGLRHVEGLLPRRSGRGSGRAERGEVDTTGRRQVVHASKRFADVVDHAAAVGEVQDPIPFAVVHQRSRLRRVDALAEHDRVEHVRPRTCVDGSVGAAESSFARSGSLPGSSVIATGNLTLFARESTLVVNSGRLAGLDSSEQRILRDAAAATLTDVVAQSEREASEAADFCRDIGDAVTVSDADRAAFEAAVQPVYDMLDTDETTRTLISRIRALSAEVTPAAPVEACTHQLPATGDSTGPSATIPPGTYVKKVDRAVEIARALDPAVVDEFLDADGQLTLQLVIDGDRWTESQVFDDGTTEVGDLGTFSYDDQGRWVTVSTSGGCRGCTGTLDWTFKDGVLTLNADHNVPNNELDDSERLHSEGEWVTKA